MKDDKKKLKMKREKEKEERVKRSGGGRRETNWMRRWKEKDRAKGGYKDGGQGEDKKEGETEE